MTPEERKRRIDTIQTQINALEQEKAQLEEACHHEIVCDDCESARCSICNEDFGWYCEISPDHVCHYTSEMSKNGWNRCVELIDGTRQILPSSYNHLDESMDWCIFCGAPNERK